MKLVLGSLFTVGLLSAAEQFATGQAARLIIGQETFTAQSPVSSASVIGAVSGLAVAGDTLFVSDSSRVEGSSPQNHRILMFRGLSSNIPKKTDEYFWTRPCPACIGTADTVLGQADFTAREFGLRQDKLRTPTGIHSDGQRLVVADTDNNRVLIWNSIPASNSQPADIVLGQASFTTASLPPNRVPTASSMRGPQAVWIQGNRLFVADTQNHRVLIWNNFPTANNAPADVVLGQPNFTTATESVLSAPTPEAKNLLNPVWVSSDGQRLFVADLGHNRILIWNSIPSTTQQPADVVVGQPNMTSWFPNNSEALCESNGTHPDDETIKLYPKRCLATLDFPRAVVSDGTKLFIADSGSDRVLIFNRIPTGNGTPADIVLGQLGGGINQASDASDSMRTPMAIALNGEDLYVSDCFNRRILIYSPAERNVPYTGVRNAASRNVFALGSVTFSLFGEFTKDEEIVITVGYPDENGEAVNKEYKYKIVEEETIENVVDQLVSLINADGGDPNVIALPNFLAAGVILTSRRPGSEGNSVTFTATVNPVNDTTPLALSAQTSGATLTGGQDAARIAPGTLVTVLGDNLSELTEAAPADASPLPNTMANTQVYFDGVRAPLLYVSPTQINAQIPFEVRDRTSLNAWVRTALSDGTIRVTSPVAVTIVTANPGIFAEAGPDPRPGIVYHASEYATGTIAIDGSVTGDQVVHLTIDGSTYSYTQVGDDNPDDDTPAGDTLDTVRDKLIELINNDESARVRAEPGRTFTRIRLLAKEIGEAGVGIRYSGGSFAKDTKAFATATVTFSGTPVAGERVVLTLGETNLPETNIDYVYTIQEGDTLEGVMNGISGVLNADRTARASAATDAEESKVTLTARLTGETGNSTAFTVRVIKSDDSSGSITPTASGGVLEGGITSDGSITISNYTPALCCPNKGRVTLENPAAPGEQLLLLTTGVGEPAERSAVTGEKYPEDGPLTEPVQFMNSLVGGRTANIIYARLLPGSVGVYEVLLELNPDLPTNPLTQMWVAQDIYISNVVTVPVFNPRPPQ